MCSCERFWLYTKELAKIIFVNYTLLIILMKKRNDNSFYILAWLGFLTATVSYIIGIQQLQADIQTKGFFSICFFFAIFATFTLGKVIRDRLDSTDDNLK